MYFDRIGIVIEAYKKGGHEQERFGRIIPVKKGLTIIAGDNTSGKTTLAKCFYYILGVKRFSTASRMPIQWTRVFTSSLTGRMKTENCTLIWWISHVCLPN